MATRTRITKITGHSRVQAVELEHFDTGARRVIDCDTVVFTGDWIPDNELARAADLEMDPATRGPLIDTAQAHQHLRGVRHRQPHPSSGHR